jgi:hypothetical protein
MCIEALDMVKGGKHGHYSLNEDSRTQGPWTRTWITTIQDFYKRYWLMIGIWEPLEFFIHEGWVSRPELFSREKKTILSS